MNETIQEKIDRFRLYNRTMIAAAIAKRNRRHQGLPAKLLLCSIFDSLSIVAFPNENSVGKRYKQTIADHAQWSDHDRVSLLQLYGVLGRVTALPASFDSLKAWVTTELSKKFPSSQRMLSSHVGLSRDPCLNDVMTLWPISGNGKPEKIDNIYPDQFTHRSLLWKYRNQLTHEFRLPGRGAQSAFRNELTPYYQEVSTITDIDPVEGLVMNNHWELIYPTGFFLRVVKTSLESICKKYKVEGTSPFLHYREASSWL